jgi:chromosome segregation ATPase
MDGTVIAVSAIGAVAKLGSAVLGALSSYRWGQKALALKDQQLQQLQQLKNETIAVKDAQLDQLKLLTAPQLLDHFQSQQALYEARLTAAQKEVSETAAALQASQLDVVDREKLQDDLAASQAEVRELNARLTKIRDRIDDFDGGRGSGWSPELDPRAGRRGSSVGTYPSALQPFD